MKHRCRFGDMALGPHEIEFGLPIIKRSRIPLVAHLVVGVPKLAQPRVVAVDDDRQVVHDDLRVQHRAETTHSLPHHSVRISSLESLKALCNLYLSTKPTNPMVRTQPLKLHPRFMCISHCGLSRLQTFDQVVAYHH